MAHELGTGMFTGKRWTLKMSKDDETTPGPAYNPKIAETLIYQSNVSKEGRLEV